MAESTTVYPFGTGGSMPDSIAVINDLFTGGANVALSAGMGKSLGIKTRVIFDDMESTHTSSSELTASTVGSGLLEYNPTTHKVLFFYMADAGDTYATCIESDPDTRLFYGDTDNNIYRWNSATTSFIQVGGSASGGVAGIGTFADAYDAAVINSTAIFQWILNDVDDGNNAVRKPIWHIGDKVFIDAIGSVVSGTKNGVVIKASTTGKVYFKGSGLTTTAGELDFINGEITYSFAEVAKILKDANNAPASPYNGKSLQNISSSVVTPTTLEIDFGWAVVTPPSGGQTAGTGMAPFTAIYKMDIGSSGVSLYNVFCHGTFGANTFTSRLKKLQIRGKATSLYRFCACGTDATQGLTEVDASGLTITSNASMQESFKSERLDGALNKIDIRGLDTSGVTNMSSFCVKRQGLATLIIGNFSTVSVTSYSNFFSLAEASASNQRTLVCTTDAPPVMNPNWNFITGNFTTIKVPNKTVVVDGEEVAVIDRYKAASGWSTHAGIMSTYEEGEY